MTALRHHAAVFYDRWFATGDEVPYLTLAAVAAVALIGALACWGPI